MTWSPTFSLKLPYLSHHLDMSRWPGDEEVQALCSQPRSRKSSALLSHLQRRSIRANCLDTACHLISRRYMAAVPARHIIRHEASGCKPNPEP